MSNRTFVCFDCRTTERVSAGRITRNCRKCRQRAEYVYYKFRIPAKRDDDGWAALMHKVRSLNVRTQTAALARLRDRREKFTRMLAEAPSTRITRRRTFARRVKDLDEQVAAWLRW